MSQTQSFITFIIVSFVFAGVILLKRESLPEKLKRPLALFALFLIITSFVLILYSFTAGVWTQ